MGTLGLGYLTLGPSRRVRMYAGSSPALARFLSLSLSLCGNAIRQEQCRRPMFRHPMPFRPSLARAAIIRYVCW